MAGIRVHRNYQKAPHVVVDVRAINQAILNVLDNAVRSSATDIWLDVDANGESVTVSIADNGVGVDQAIEKKIFDPFFTTRNPGVGTGLGLHLAMQTISEHDGDLWHERRPDGGAVFRIKLPAGRRSKTPATEARKRPTEA
jgi:signal transduction histidine kinase